MGAPFSLDPSATAAFAKLEPDVGAQALHDTAAPVRAVVIGGGTGAPVSIRTLLSLKLTHPLSLPWLTTADRRAFCAKRRAYCRPAIFASVLSRWPLTRVTRSPGRSNTVFVCAQSPLGNLMLSALEESTGSFPEAIDICSRLLNARGRVFPSTLDEVRLCARDMGTVQA